MRSFVGKSCSKVIFDVYIVFKLISPTTLPHFFYGVSFSPMYLFEDHLFPFPGSTFDFVINKAGSSFLTGAEMEITTHCFKNSLTMVAITINTEAISFLLCSCSVVTLNFAIRSFCLLLESMTRPYFQTFELDFAWP